MQNSYPQTVIDRLDWSVIRRGNPEKELDSMVNPENDGEELTFWHSKTDSDKSLG